MQILWSSTLPGRALLVIVLATAGLWKTQCAPLQPANIHTVVPVECTHGYFEWQVIGLAYRCRACSLYNFSGRTIPVAVDTSYVLRAMFLAKRWTHSGT